MPPTPTRTKSNFAKLCKTLGYDFRDETRLSLALSHRSVGAANNERLEFLGDSLLNTFIAEALFEQFPTAKEGDLSALRASLVKGETLAELAKEFQLGEYLQLGEGERKSGGHRRASILADAVEAIVAAIYLDSDFLSCRAQVLRWFATRLKKATMKIENKDPKSLLQEWLQGRGQALPEYNVIATEGAAHEQEFTVACLVASLPEPITAKGRNRRLAEKKAAELALEQLQEQQT